MTALSMNGTWSARAHLGPARPSTGSLTRLFNLAAILYLASGFFSGFLTLSNLLFGAAASLTVAALLWRRACHVVVAWPAAYLSWLLASALVVGSLPNWETLNGLGARVLAFLVGEGRVFLTFFPLLLCATCRPQPPSLEWLVRLSRLIAWAGLTMATVGQLPPLRGAFYRHGTDQLFALASSHHVSGFMFGIAALVLLSTHRGPRRSNLWLGVATLGTVVLTGSRTTLVGLAIAGVAAIVLRASSRLSAGWMRRLRLTLLLGGVLLIPLQSSLRVEILQPETIRSGIERFTSTEPPSGGEFEPRTANVLKRFALWGSATESFLSSPIVGVGAFRFNDDVQAQSGIEGFIYLATKGDREHTVATAHNSYIHVSAETGLAGLFLLLGGWFALGRLLLRQRSENIDPEVRSDADRGLLLLVFALATGLTSSSLLTPGLSVPVLLYIGSIALRGDLGRGSTLATV